MQLRQCTACLIILTFACLNALTTGQSNAPTLTYTCNTKGEFNITLSDITGYSRVTILKDGKLDHMIETSSISRKCEKELSTISKDITLTGCTLGNQLYVYIMKENLQTIYGGNGFHEYIISCYIPADGVTVTAIASASLAPKLSTSPTLQTLIPTLSVTMTIDPASGIFIGQPLSLTISLNNALSLYVLPESCDAYAGDTTTGSPLKLLNTSGTTDAAVMTNFDFPGPSTAHATIYAFRFISSPIVTIKCLLHICKDESCNSKFQVYASTPAPASTTTPAPASTTTPAPASTPTPAPTAAPIGRKRRAAEISGKRSSHSTHVVNAMFTVKEERKTTSGQSAVFNSVVLMVAMFELQRILQD